MNSLKLTHPRTQGPGVVRLQEHLDALGFDCGDHDGIYGTGTAQAVEEAQKRFGLNPDGVVGPETWEALTAALADLQGGEKETSTPKGGTGDIIVDRRGKHPRPKLYGHGRTWADIDGVTLHQTGCRMSTKPEGWDRLGAHIGITSAGQMIIANDPTDMIWHAQGLSKSTVGIEIGGNFCGVEGKESTLWKEGGGPDTLTDKMLAALEECFKWLQAEFQKNGVAWKSVHAHRQSCDTRRADPGSEIWSKVGMVWLNRIGGTDGGKDWHLKEGRPIPSEWNPDYPSKY